MSAAASRLGRCRIDEPDCTDEPFEAFLLEVPSDFQITIPELGTIRAAEPPLVVITSNRTREIHDALKRRCFHHWVDYPNVGRERRIVAVKTSDAPAAFSAQVVAFVQRLRGVDLLRPSWRRWREMAGTVPMQHRKRGQQPYRCMDCGYNLTGTPPQGSAAVTEGDGGHVVPWRAAREPDGQPVEGQPASHA